MRIAGIVGGIMLVLLGGVWTLQGANVLTGSAVMSGHSEWMWIGLVVVLAGLAVLWTSWRRPR